jgi:hypothetical protein
VKYIARFTRLDSLWLSNTASPTPALNISGSSSGLRCSISMARASATPACRTWPGFVASQALLADTQVTKAGLAQLRKELPQTQIDAG